MALVNALVEAKRIQFNDANLETIQSPVRDQIMQFNSNTWSTQMNPFNQSGISYTISRYHQTDGQSINNADAVSAAFIALWDHNMVPNISETGRATWTPSTKEVEVAFGYGLDGYQYKLKSVQVTVIDKITGSGNIVFAIGNGTNINDRLRYNFMLGAFPPQEGAELLRVYWNNWATQSTWNMLMLSYQGETEGSEPLGSIDWGTSTKTNPFSNAGFTFSFDKIGSDLPTLKSLGMLKDESFQTVVNNIANDAAANAGSSLSKLFVTR